MSPFIDVEGASITIDEPDPQNLCEEDWDERLGGVAAVGREYEAWVKKTRKKKRRGR